MDISSFGIKIPDSWKVYGKEMRLSLMVSLHVSKRLEAHR